MEDNPAFIHGGPFANIAHGCNSVIATKLAMRLADYTVTEAGFGADLGAEKFMDIKCRKAGIQPRRGGAGGHGPGVEDARRRAPKELHKPNVEALDKGMDNLKKHIENIHRFGLPVVVAINHFTSDTDEEIQCIRDKCAYLAVKIVRADHWARGGAGRRGAGPRGGRSRGEHQDRLLPPLSRHLHPLGKGGHHLPRDLRRHRRPGRQEGPREVPALQEAGFGHLPICMAKTQYSLSTDPGLVGRPKNFDVPCAT